MKLLGRVVVAAMLVIVAIWVLKLAAGLIVGTVLFAFRLAIFAAIVAGAVWAYRRLTSRGRPRTGARRRPASLGRPKAGIDMQYIRGKISREEYMRRKSRR